MERPEIIKYLKKGDKMVAASKAGVSLNVVARRLNGYTDNGIVGIYLEEIAKARKAAASEFAKELVNKNI